MFYKCGKCGVAGVKLWRLYNTFLSHQQLFCAPCAILDQGLPLSTRIDPSGRHASPLDGGAKTDQIGSLIPACPDLLPDPTTWTLPEDGTFWGYTSVPESRVVWWRGLPSSPAEEGLPVEPGQIEALEKAEASAKKREREKYEAWCKEMIDRTFAIVEATSFEKLTLWSENDRRGSEKGERFLAWVEHGMGLTETVGMLDERPVCVTLFWADIEGQTVAFLDATSSVVDHAMIDAWVEKTFPKSIRRSNAMNFHNVIAAILERGSPGKLH